MYEAGQNEATQGNAKENAPLHAGRIPQAVKQGCYDARSTDLSKIARNCWCPSCLRLYRNEYSSRYDCKYAGETW